jgi:all-trans-retinol 13,14-reductase
MRLGTSYKQHPIEGDFDTIVIGSGIGGLTAAALLANEANERVLVLEQHYTAGGFTHTFRRKGYEWDVGVHYVGEVMNPKREVRQIFDAITDGNLKWACMGEVYDTIIIGEERYEFVKGVHNFKARMKEYFPGEEAAIEAYVQRVKTVVANGKLYFAEKALPRPLSAVVGGWMRSSVLKDARKTTADVLAELTDNVRLRAVLAGQFGDYGLSPSQGSFFVHSMVVNHYFEGGAYPIGGSAQIAATILPVIERAGGKVFTNATVDEILVERNRAVGVRLADGREIRAPKVISGAGVHTTFRKLVPRAVAEQHGFPDLARKVQPSVGHLSLYLGFEQTAAELDLPRSNLWVFPSDDHDANMARLSTDPENAEMPAVYISFPGAKDPSFTDRYPGRTTVEVVTLAPYAWFAKWEERRWMRRGPDYDALKEHLSDRLLEALYTQCPQLRGKVAFQNLSTPLSTRHFANFSNGEIYGLAQSPKRFAQRWLRPSTPIKGLYLTGADICSAGVAGALFGGVLTVSAMLLRDMRGACARRAKALAAEASPALPAVGAQGDAAPRPGA